MTGSEIQSSVEFSKTLSIIFIQFLMVFSLGTLRGFIFSGVSKCPGVLASYTLIYRHLTEARPCTHTHPPRPTHGLPDAFCNFKVSAVPLGMVIVYRCSA